MNENDLIMKYVVFKIKDIKECLSDNEEKLFWSFLEKIIKIRERQVEDKVGNQIANERLLSQFNYDVIHHRENVLYKDEMIEMLKRYDLYRKPKLII